MKTGLTSDVEGLDDVKDFAVMEKSMNDCGFDGAEKANVFRVTAAVLHIGQLDFEEDGSGNAGVKGDSNKTLAGLSAMLGLDADAVKKALCSTRKISMIPFLFICLYLL